MEKLRDKSIASTHMDNQADFRQIGLDESIEKIYFDK